MSLPRLNAPIVRPDDSSKAAVPSISFRAAASHGGHSIANDFFKLPLASARGCNFREVLDRAQSNLVEYV
jgi:hypothetical protein